MRMRGSSAAIQPAAYVLNPGGLETQPRAERTLTHSSPQTLGTSVGEWCSYGSGPDLPLDQREDDARSLCFDTAPLGRRMEILGPPVAELELSVDRPQAFVVARLNDVAPDGQSTRVSFGLLNLAHRDSHETPAPLEPGRRYKVRVQLNDIAHAFPRGHRIRLALSTAYWPLIWPSPEPVTLTLHSGASRLLLPVRPKRAEDKALPRFPAAAGAVPERRTLLTSGQYRRTLTRDLATGACAYLVESDDGRQRLDDHGVELGYRYVQRFEITPDDPLSAVQEATHWLEVGRGDWAVSSATNTVMTATKDAFLIRASLDASEGGVRVVTRTWNVTIPRDCV